MPTITTLSTGFLTIINWFCQKVNCGGLPPHTMGEAEEFIVAELFWL